MLKMVSLVSLLFLAGCQTSLTGLVDKPTLADVPAELLQECGKLVDIPDRDLQPNESAVMWGTDRDTGGVCIDRNARLVRSIKALKSQGQ